MGTRIADKQATAAKPHPRRTNPPRSQGSRPPFRPTKAAPRLTNPRAIPNILPTANRGLGNRTLLPIALTVARTRRTISPRRKAMANKAITAPRHQDSNRATAPRRASRRTASRTGNPIMDSRNTVAPRMHNHSTRRIHSSRSTAGNLIRAMGRASITRRWTTGTTSISQGRLASRTRILIVGGRIRIRSYGDGC